jgi:hypothetical protein
MLLKLEVVVAHSSPPVCVPVKILIVSLLSFEIPATMIAHFQAVSSRFAVQWIWTSAPVTVAGIVKYAVFFVGYSSEC